METCEPSKISYLYNSKEGIRELLVSGALDGDLEDVWEVLEHWWCMSDRQFTSLVLEHIVWQERA